MLESSQTVSEKRSFERFEARYPAKIKDTRDEFGVNLSLRNASAEGIRLISRDRIYVNDSISIEVRLPDNDSPMTIRGEVVWAKLLPNKLWDIGLKCHKGRFYEYGPALQIH